MKTKKIIFSSIIAGCFFVACDLDTKPYKDKDIDQIAPEELQALTLGTYGQLKKANALQHTWHFFGEYGGDNIAQGSASSDALTNIIHYRRLNDNYHCSNLWKECYVGIVNINTCLGIGVEGVSYDVDHVIGENYFLRAYQYLLLCTVFGQPYSNNPTQNLGIPLKLSADPNDYPPRSTVAQVYDQIISDLKNAIRLMELQAPAQKRKNSCYATKEAAEALLSRVYLYMGDNVDPETGKTYMQLAGEYADKVITSGYYSLEQGERYATYPQIVPEENSETIFATRNVKDIDDLKWSSIGSMYAKVDNIGYGEIFASSTYLDLLEQYPQDLRNRLIDKQSKGDGTLWFIYNKQQADGKYNYNTVTVVEENGSYKLSDTNGDYQSTQVGVEEFNGGVRYYVIEKTGTKYYGRVEEQMQLGRLGHPMYYVLKCSKQEGQAQLYSPVVLRLADMYLTRAESRYHSGDLSGAIEDLNVIRKRAGIPEWSSNNLPEGKTLLDLILEERRLELAFEALRRADIFRVKGFVDRRYPGHHNDGTPFYQTINYNDPQVAEYIPQRELDAYPIALEQNP